MTALLSARAEREIRTEIESLEKSSCPDPDMCEGMIQLAYRLGLISDSALSYWTHRLAITVVNRRQQLLSNRQQRWLEEVRA